jgi:hypothetical protein
MGIARITDMEFEDNPDLTNTGVEVTALDPSISSVTGGSDFAGYHRAESAA